VDLVRRLARAAGIPAWEKISPHSLRHSAITFALDAGVPLRDVQDYAQHKDPRTTRRYDHSRDSLDRNAAYTVAAYLGLDAGRCSAGPGPPTHGRCMTYTLLQTECRVILRPREPRPQAVLRQSQRT
jgi:integrase-like protein